MANIGQSFLINNAEIPTMELGESSLIWVVRFKIESVITFGVEFFRSLVPLDLWVRECISPWQLYLHLDRILQFKKDECHSDLGIIF